MQQEASNRLLVTRGRGSNESMRTAPKTCEERPTVGTKKVDYMKRRSGTARPSGRRTGGLKRIGRGSGKTIRPGSRYQRYDPLRELIATWSG